MTTREDIEFMLRHFEGQIYLFPRRIATIKSQLQEGERARSGGQFPVMTTDEILKYYARAENKECRLNAYSFDPTDSFEQLPSILFIEVDSLDERDLKKIINHMKKYLVISYPTVICSGRGFHIIQPIDVSKWNETPAPAWFLEAQNKNWEHFRLGVVNEFLRWAEQFLSGQQADVCHKPTIKSCLLRPPGTINAKINKEVTVYRAWDGKRPPVDLLLGEFYTDRLRKYNEHVEKENRIREKASTAPFVLTDQYYDTYIPKILETTLPDYRERMMSLVIVPYLYNIKNLPEEQVYDITRDWLERCSAVQPLRFDYSLIWTKMRNTKTYNYRPMGKAKLVREMSLTSPTAHSILQTKLFSFNSQQKEVIQERYDK